TRRLAVTEVGQEVYRHAKAMLAEAEAAVEAVELARAEPRGTVRVSAPIALAQAVLAPIVPAFLGRYLAVRLELQVSNRRVDVLAEGIDVALRVRSRPGGEGGLVMRAFAQAHEYLVASPDYLARAGTPTEPRALAAHATLDYGPDLERGAWRLTGPSGAEVSVEHQPRLLCHDFVVLHAVARAGLGIARLPEMLVREDLRSGVLQQVLPEWTTPQGVVHAVFPTRRGLLPAVRAFIDFLAAQLPGSI
ncbi:MAG: LysR family transcriptional regulator, partial [Gammaproteobacteria bacterium]|nr:LysR family transcriptional regulator [Gammaproteobacteria bacterium]